MSYVLWDVIRIFCCLVLLETDVGVFCARCLLVPSRNICLSSGVISFS